MENETGQLTRQTQAAGGARLAVYFLLDCSGSMRQEALDKARQLISRVMLFLKLHHKQETPLLTTVIMFQAQAMVLAPLTPPDRLQISDLQLEGLEASGPAVLEGAFRAVRESMMRELTAPGTRDGDERPVLVMLTAGEPCLRSAASEYGRDWDVLTETCAFVMLFGQRTCAEISENLGHRIQCCLAAHEIQTLENMLLCEIKRLEVQQRLVVYPPNYGY